MNDPNVATHPATGYLLVTSYSGDNADSVVEFDAARNFLVCFIDSVAGGISSPWSLIFRDSDALLSHGIADGTYSFAHDGTFLKLWEDDTANLSNFPEQITEIANGNILAATFSSPSGVWESGADHPRPGERLRVAALGERRSGERLVASRRVAGRGCDLRRHRPRPWRLHGEPLPGEQRSGHPLVMVPLSLTEEGGGGGLTPGRSLTGRWVDDGYEVIVGQSGNRTGLATLGTVHEPDHPLMDGVSTFDGGTSSFRPDAGELTAGSASIADWSDPDGIPLIAVHGTLPNRADLGFYPPSSDCSATWWDSATDGGRIMAKALVYVAGGGDVRASEPVDMARAGAVSRPR